jgi:hypothetical protein
MKETYTYICHYCQKKYVPTRRKAQKFCSASCKVRNHQEKNKTSNSTENNKAVSLKEKQSSPSKPTNHLADIGKAAVGNLAAQGVTSLFTPLKNKPATKGDIENLSKLITGGRYRKIVNFSPNQLGQIAYFDLQTNRMVYESNNLSNCLGVNRKK